jgi:hypothetical protein
MPVYPAGIRTTTADFIVSNLKIGQSYNLTQIAGTPYRAELVGGTQEMDIALELLSPGNTNQTQPGYEPIPDIKWIKLSRDRITAFPNESMTSDIIITLPNDEKYLGKKYEFFLHASLQAPRTKPGSVGVTGGVQSSIRFSIADKPATPEEIERLKKLETKVLSLNFLPTEVVLFDVVAGSKYDVKKKTGQSLKLINSSNEPVRFRIMCVPILSSGLTVPFGYEPEPDVKFMNISKEKIVLASLSIKEIDFSIKFPARDEYKGKKYIYLIEASTEGEKVETKYYSRIFVNMKN